MKVLRSRFSSIGWTVAAVIYAAIFLTILVLAYTGHLPPFVMATPYFDKVGHVVLYCIATFLGHLVLNRRHVRLGGYAVPLWVLLFGSFTVTEELLQSLSPNRTLDIVDLIASSMGIALGYWLAERGRSKPR